MSGGRARITAFTVALVAALIVFLPMRLALAGFGASGLSARAVSGSVWHGTLADAGLGPVPLGTIDARLKALPLLAGHARIALARSDPDPLALTLDLSPRGFGVAHARGHIPAAALFGNLPIAGLDLDDVSAAFADGRCTAASGTVRAALAGPLAGPALSGEARCDGAALLVPLAGAAGGIDVRVFADGRDSLSATIRGGGSLGAALRGAGFAEVPGGAALRRDGTF